MKLFLRYVHFLSFFLCAMYFAQIDSVHAEVPGDSQAGISYGRRLSLARDFVARLKEGIGRADKYMGIDEKGSGIVARNILPEGEFLIFQPVLEKGFKPEGFVAAQMRGGKVVLSLADFVDVLRFAIDVDFKGRKAGGWYISEDKSFSLDIGQREVSAGGRDYILSDDLFIEDGQIYIPVDEIARWFDFEIDVRVEDQEFVLMAGRMLPVQEAQERKKSRHVRSKDPKPSLPLGGEGYSMASVPVIDVSTNSTYNKGGNADRGVDSHRAYVKTVGDFAKGTLSTASSLDDENKLSRVHATYRRESVEGDLLGILKAKRVEVGDVTTAQTPLGGGVSKELGFRITNTDPLRSFSRAHTVISGSAIPGWDVELYRRNQFLGLVNVGDDGFYRFDDVNLYTSENSFKLVFYGPQGERHEEYLFVPYDKDLLARSGGIYDVSVSFDGKNAYIDRDLKNRSEDAGSLNFAALYERPLFAGVTGSAGFRSSENGGERDYIVSTGLSMTLKEALVNADFGVDDEGEKAGELSVRRDFGEHELSYRGSWNEAGFDGNSSAAAVAAGSFSNFASVNGPFYKPYEGMSSRYNSSFSYQGEEGGDSFLSGSAGLNMGYRNVAFSGSLNYATGDSMEDDLFDTTLSLNVRRGKDFLRLNSNYDIAPEAKLDNISASYSRDVSEKMDVNFAVSKDVDQSLTSYQARLDWQAGFIHISPNISYNSRDDFFAGLNTRFGLTREPISGDLKMFDRAMTGNAFVSAFVYLDKNGDGEFNGDDEPLPDVMVSAPQNGNNAKTDKNGIALFKEMKNLRLTDVFIEEESLPDPAWIPGFEGLSILPREGYVAEIEFPVHWSGELDGVVYTKIVSASYEESFAEIEPAGGVVPEEGQGRKDDSSEGMFDGAKPVVREISPQPERQVPLRNIELQLYNEKGEIAQSVVSDYDGFYYFTGITPGRYLLMISEESAARKNIIRPQPQPIEISYEGTVIYDHRIFAESGEGDVPSEILSDIKSYKERHPHVDFSEQDLDGELILNLGEFNSRLLMSVVWYKLRTRYAQLLGEVFRPLVSAAQSYSDSKSGKHVLRVMIKDKTLEQAYAMCRSFMARGQYCKVEILPSYIGDAYMKLASSGVEAVDKENNTHNEKSAGVQALGAPLDITGSALLIP